MGNLELDYVIKKEHMGENTAAYVRSYAAQINRDHALQTNLPQDMELEAIIDIRTGWHSDTITLKILNMPEGCILRINRNGLFGGSLNYSSAPSWVTPSSLHLEIQAETGPLYPSLNNISERDPTWFREKLCEMWDDSLRSVDMRAFQADNGYYVEVVPQLRDPHFFIQKDGLPQTYMISRDAIYLLYRQMGSKPNVFVGLYNKNPSQLQLPQRFMLESFNR